MALKKFEEFISESNVSNSGKKGHEGVDGGVLIA